MHSCTDVCVLVCATIFVFFVCSCSVCSSSPLFIEDEEQACVSTFTELNEAIVDGGFGVETPLYIILCPETKITPLVIPTQETLDITASDYDISIACSPLSPEEYARMIFPMSARAAVALPAQVEEPRFSRPDRPDGRRGRGFTPIVDFRLPSFIRALFGRRNRIDIGNLVRNIINRSRPRNPRPSPPSSPPPPTPSSPPTPSPPPQSPPPSPSPPPPPPTDTRKCLVVRQTSEDDLASAGIVVQNVTGTLKLDGIAFSQVGSPVGNRFTDGFLFSDSTIDVSIVDSSFSNFTSGAIELRDVSRGFDSPPVSNISVRSTRFEQNQSGSIDVFRAFEVVIEDSLFAVNNSSDFGSNVLIDRNVHTRIVNSNFTENLGSFGGAGARILRACMGMCQ